MYSHGWLKFEWNPCQQLLKQSFGLFYIRTIVMAIVMNDWNLHEKSLSNSNCNIVNLQCPIFRCSFENDVRFPFDRAPLYILSQHQGF